MCLHFFSDEESIYGVKAILYQDDACEDSDDDVEEISSKWGQTRLDDISDTASTISSASSDEIGKNHALKKYDQFAFGELPDQILSQLCNFTKFLLQK